MSKPKGGGTGRFAVMQSLGEVKEAEEQPPVEAEGPEKAAHFSSYLYPSTKKKLKYMTLKEGRKAQEILEDALAAYIEKHHPKIPDDL